MRDQIEMRLLSLDQMLPPDDQARVVWAFVQSLDLSEFYGDIKAVEGHPGRNPVDPAILLAVWLYATLDGVGSARRINKLCERHITYMWLTGGVSVNHRLLSEFRSASAERLEPLLTSSVAALLEQDLVSLERVAQDGMRVRAGAGQSSFRRGPSLEECLRQAEEQVERLKQELEDDPQAADRRQQAARQRAAQERLERVRQAAEHLPQVAEKMEQRKKGDGEKARASTTDPEARKMKMPDGGFRPAYNVQFATTAETRVIVEVDVVNSGGDAGQMGPLVESIAEHYAQRPAEYLVDGGFAALKDIDTLENAGTQVFAPVKDKEKKEAQGEDPFAARPGDTAKQAAWRKRMGTAEAQAIYRERPSIAEFPNAVCRNQGLRQFLVRGLQKVKAVALWHALAFNLRRFQNLGLLNQLS